MVHWHETGALAHFTGRLFLLVIVGKVNGWGVMLHSACMEMEGLLNISFFCYCVGV